ncbi:hypothetical protein Pelo_10047 [Pelomyxa schiedti]|nr:hypothetical protein Pelo_10047 [Pelomyxa schiedti]
MGATTNKETRKAPTPAKATAPAPKKNPEATVSVSKVPSSNNAPRTHNAGCGGVVATSNNTNNKKNQLDDESLASFAATGVLPQSTAVSSEDRSRMLTARRAHVTRVFGDTSGEMWRILPNCRNTARFMIDEAYGTATREIVSERLYGKYSAPFHNRWDRPPRTAGAVELRDEEEFLKQIGVDLKSQGVLPEGDRPPLNEEQMKAVEATIAWRRQRPCVEWARNLRAAGFNSVLLSCACSHAWADWYTVECQALMKTSSLWKRILLCSQDAQRAMVSFICGSHPRAGKHSPLQVLSSDILQAIANTSVKYDCTLSDGLQREPPPTDVDISLDCYRSSWTKRDDIDSRMTAFGNYSPEEHIAETAIDAVGKAYKLLFDSGVWVRLDDFIEAVEAGNIGVLKCIALFQSAECANAPPIRFMAQRLCETLIGSSIAKEVLHFRKCFTGDGKVTMANGTKKCVKDIVVGDIVATEATPKSVVKIEVLKVNAVTSMCWIGDTWLTPGHPISVNGNWIHPFEAVSVQERFVSELFNFELEGGPLSPNHSVWINGVLVCTLGKDCGPRITTGWPRANEIAGTGYWRNSSSHWAKSVLSHLHCEV